MLLLGLSAGHKIGLAAVGVAFIVFALSSAFLFPRLQPDFPGRQGLRLFILVTLAFFVSMMGAVTVFGKESEEKAASSEASGTTSPSAGRIVQVSAKDFKLELSSTSMKAGSYTFSLKNEGQSQHNLVVKGPGVKDTSTPTIAPGKTASLKVNLSSGSYELYCSVPGHKQLGMDVKLTVT